MNDLDVQLTPKTWTLMDEPGTIESERAKSLRDTDNHVKKHPALSEHSDSTEKVDSVATEKVPETKLSKASKSEAERPVSRLMNDRYPIIETGRKPSETGLKALKRKVSQKGLGAIRRISYTRKASKESSASEKGRKVSDSSAENGRYDGTGVTRDGRNPITSHSKNFALTDARRPSTPIQEIASPRAEDIGQSGNCVSVAAQPRQNTVSVQQRPKSAFDLRARYKSSRNDLRDGSINIRRKTAEPTAMLGQSFEDPTLRKISAGPYATDNSTTADLPDMRNSTVAKENASPTLSTIGVAIGSPSWMKGTQCVACTPPSADKERARYASTNRTSIRAVQSSRELRGDGANSPVVYSSINRRAVGKGSPGQRMVDDFMKRKREGESPVSNATGGGAFL